MRFYASVKNRRGNEKGGSVDSAHIRGWTAGVRVTVDHTDKKKDVFNIFKTSGSGATSKDILIGQIIDGVYFGNPFAEDASRAC